MSEEKEDYFFLKLLICTNAIIGWVCLEYAWFLTRRYRNPNKDLDDLYPAYRRADALKWKKCWLYPGALTLLVPRMLITFIAFLSLYFWLSVAMLGHDRDIPV